MKPFALVKSAALATLLLLTPAVAQEKVWHHGLAASGEPKYPAGFERFDYVNPDAPKGGTVRLGDMGSFDTFNPILPQGEVATGIGVIYEPLMVPSQDEVLTDYGLLAESVSYPDDVSSATFRMNPNARWHDGQPVTAADVIWSFDKVKELNPNYAQYFANITSAEETAPGEVTFTFDEVGNRELPKILAGDLLILPKHWWEGTDANGNQRNIAASTLEPPLGSGPYKVGTFEAGRTITYDRVEDYWGKDHPTQIGHNNFDHIRYEFFLDLTVQFEAFKGDTIDWWLENQAKRWATAYDFPAANDGRVIRELFPQAYNGSGVMVGFAPNLRKPIFQNEKVREALNYAFDFEELNRTLFYGQYERIDSFFFGLPFRWTGLPQGEELEILESVRDLVPPSVFDTEFTNPVSGDPAKLRENLRTALGLLTEAGYTLNGDKLVDASGTPLTFEILLNGPTIEPVAVSFQQNLAQIGIDVSIRTVDSPQYINRVRSFDYDMIYSAWGQSMSPGNEQRFQWGSEAAAEEGSQNYLGITDPGIDALIEKIIFADDEATLHAATAALDRTLMAHHFIVPSYSLRNARVARWDRFSYPETLPEFGIGFPNIWWWDEAKAAKTGGNVAQ